MIICVMTLYSVVMGTTSVSAGLYLGGGGALAPPFEL